jgi:hypothetical protein
VLLDVGLQHALLAVKVLDALVESCPTRFEIGSRAAPAGASKVAAGDPRLTPDR